MCVFAGCFLVCFLLKRHLGLTNCTVSTSMSFCKLFHHLWKFPRYHAFRLLAKQKVWDYGLIVEKKTTGIGENIQWSWGILAFLLNRQGSYFTQMHGNFGFISGGLLVCTLKSSLRLGHQNLARLTARPSRTHFLLIVILGRNRSNWWDAMISNDTVDGSEIRLTTARMPQMLVFFTINLVFWVHPKRFAGFLKHPTGIFQAPKIRGCRHLFRTWLLWTLQVWSLKMGGRFVVFWRCYTLED